MMVQKIIAKTTCDTSTFLFFRLNKSIVIFVRSFFQTVLKIQQLHSNALEQHSIVNMWHINIRCFGPHKKCLLDKSTEMPVGQKNSQIQQLNNNALQQHSIAIFFLPNTRGHDHQNVVDGEVQNRLLMNQVIDMARLPIMSSMMRQTTPSGLCPKLLWDLGAMSECHPGWLGTMDSFQVACAFWWRNASPSTHHSSNPWVKSRANQWCPHLPLHAWGQLAGFLCRQRFR